MKEIMEYVFLIVKENRHRILRRILIGIIVGVVIFIAYRIIYIIGDKYFFYNYTYEWTIRRVISIFAFISIVLAFFKPISAISSTIGYPVGIYLGQRIGNYLKAIDVARHEEMARQPNYVQQSEPHHYGWLICIITYFSFLIIGLLIQKLYLKYRKKNQYEKLDIE